MVLITGNTTNEHDSYHSELLSVHENNYVVRLSATNKPNIDVILSEHEIDVMTKTPDGVMKAYKYANNIMNGIKMSILEYDHFIDCDDDVMHGCFETVLSFSDYIKSYQTDIKNWYVTVNDYGSRIKSRIFEIPMTIDSNVCEYVEETYESEISELKEFINMVENKKPGFKSEETYVFTNKN